MGVLYLVMGETKGWQWPVAAYVDSERAETHRMRAQHAAKRLWANYREIPHGIKRAVKNPYDMKGSAGLYGVEYRVEEVSWCDENEYVAAKSTPNGAEQTSDSVVSQTRRES